MIADEKLPLFGEYVLDVARGCVLRHSQPVHLRRQSYEVLKYLVENQGHLVTKDKLIEEVWQGRAVTDGSLQKCIEDVRAALGSEARKYVRNERGRGYIFDPDIVENGRAASVTSEHIDDFSKVGEHHRDLGHGLTRDTTRVSHSGSTKTRTVAVGWIEVIGDVIKRHKVTAVASGVLCLIVLAVISYIYFARGSKRPINSVAILPFINASNDPNIEYLSDGISESLINNLSQLPQLKVISRSSAFQYKSKQVEPDKVARALGVRAIVTGRITQQGDNLLISVELMDATDKTQMWGEQYHRPSSDLQAIQGEVARNIVQRLRLRLTGEQEQRLTKRPTENAQAYQLYLTGVFHQRKNNLDGYKKALEYFDQAVTLDPNFALAFGTMPAAYANLAGASGLDAKDAIAKGKTAALKALQLDDTLSTAHSGMAIILRYEWDWLGAERELKRAIELNPKADGAHSSYSLLLTSMGQTTEALAENKLAQELDPLRITFKGNEGGILNAARRYDEAVQVCQNVIRMQPEYPFGHVNLAHAYMGKGMFEDAIKEYKTAISLFGEAPNGMIDLGYAYAISGKRDAALSMLSKLSNKSSVSPAALAILYTGLGKKATAFQMLEQAFSKHDPLLESLKIEPRFDSLRADPRFADLLRRMKRTS